MTAAAVKNGRAPRVPLASAPVPQLPVAPAAESALTPNLDAAVLRVQAAAGKLRRNAQGQIQNRTYTYVTLDAVTDEVLPLLVDEDLLWKTFPTVHDGEPALRYRMTHVASGEYDEDVMLLLCDRTSQGQGSGDTYARRYSLCAYLNLTVDVDDDGGRASVTPPAAPQSAAAAAPASSQPVAAAPKRSERAITANQREKLLRPTAQKAGLSAGEFANVILEANGDPPRVWRTEEHASQTLERLLDRCPARLKDAVLAGIKAKAAAKGKS